VGHRGKFANKRTEKKLVVPKFGYHYVIEGKKLEPAGAGKGVGDLEGRG